MARATDVACMAELHCHCSEHHAGGSFLVVDIPNMQLYHLVGLHSTKILLLYTSIQHPFLSAGECIITLLMFN